MDLILGTAQLDSGYGLFRRQEKTNGPGMLQLAAALGFSAVDTAPSYGAAEQIIGNSKWEGAVHTKVSLGANSRESLLESLVRLKRDRVEILYFHDPSVLWGNPDFFARARENVEANRAKMLGVSIYSPKELKQAMRTPGVEAVQLPVNIADGRFSRELLQSASDRGIALYARSLFLQGALLETERALPEALEELEPVLLGLRKESASTGRSVLELAVNWAKAVPGIKGVILGAENENELAQIATAFHSEPLSDREATSLSRLQLKDDAILDPRKW